MSTTRNRIWDELDKLVSDLITCDAKRFTNAEKIGTELQGELVRRVIAKCCITNGNTSGRPNFVKHGICGDVVAKPPASKRSCDLGRICRRVHYGKRSFSFELLLERTKKKDYDL